MNRVGSHEYIYWMAFYNLDPWGGYRQDVNAANIAATFANINRGRDTKPFEVEDFLLFKKSFSDPAPMPDDQIAATLAAFFPRK